MKRIGFFSVIIVLLVSSCRQPKQLVYQNIQNFKLKQEGLQPQVCLDIRMYNPNSYGMTLKDADVDVFINGRNLGKMCVAEGCAVPGNDTFSMPVMLNVDLKDVLPNAMQLLLSSNVNVKLTGTIKAGKHGIYKKVPVDYEGMQDIRGSIKW